MTADRNAEISARAYSLWESEGRPEGRHLEHLLRAEAEAADAAPAPTVSGNTRNPIGFALDQQRWWMFASPGWQMAGESG